jgi:hypothetical protein
MWEITFFIADSDRSLTDGQWAVRIGLRGNSPPATVDSSYTMEQPAAAAEDEVVKLDLNGTLTVDQNMHIALPDAIQYPYVPCRFVVPVADDLRMQTEPVPYA